MKNVAEEFVKAVYDELRPGVAEAHDEVVEQLGSRCGHADYTHQQQRSTVAWEGRDETIDVHVLTRPH